MGRAPVDLSICKDMHLSALISAFVSEDSKGNESFRIIDYRAFFVQKLTVAAWTSKGDVKAANDEIQR